MQWWWFFTCAYNYAWIFLFININAKMPKWFFKSIIHVFLHDHFLHMWLASQVRNFEPNEYRKLPQLFNKGVISLLVLCIKISKLWNFHIFIFSSNWPNKHAVAYKEARFLLYNFFEINCIFLFIPFCIHL